MRNIFRSQFSVAMHLYVVNQDLTIKVCGYISENFRPKYSSNREFADGAGIDEKAVRLILKGEYNLSLELFKQICDSQQVKMSEILRSINE